MSSVATQVSGARRELVILKGSRAGITVWLDQEAPFAAVREGLAERLQRARAFFAGAGTAVAFAGRLLAPDELDQLTTLVQEFGLVVASRTDGPTHRPALRARRGHSLAGATSSLEEPSRRSGREVAAGSVSPAGTTSTATDATAVPMDGGLTVGPIRSGVRLVCPGHLTVLGDVNPGAEVVAVGHIVVMGQLRGVAHAGARGDRRATVTALRLAPTQLRIADLVARADESARATRTGDAEVAYVHPEEGRIVVEPLRGWPLASHLRQAATTPEA